MHPVDATAANRFSAGKGTSKPMDSRANRIAPFHESSHWSLCQSRGPGAPASSFVRTASTTQRAGSTHSANTGRTPATYYPRATTPAFVRDAAGPTTLLRVDTPSNGSSVMASEASTLSLAEAPDEKGGRAGTQATLAQKSQEIQTQGLHSMPQAMSSQGGTYFTENGGTRIVYQSSASLARTFIPNSQYFSTPSMPLASTTGGAVPFGTIIQERSKQFEGTSSSLAPQKTGHTMVTIRQENSAGVRVQIKPSGSLAERSPFATGVYTAAEPARPSPSTRLPRAHTLPIAVQYVPAPHAPHSANNVMHAMAFGSHVAPKHLSTKGRTPPVQVDTPSDAQLHQNIQGLLAFAQRAAEAAERSAKACERMTNKRGPSGTSDKAPQREETTNTIMEQSFSTLHEAIREDDIALSSGPTIEDDFRAIQELEKEIRQITDENKSFNSKDLSPASQSDLAFSRTHGNNPVVAHLSSSAECTPASARLVSNFHIGTPRTTIPNDEMQSQTTTIHNASPERKWSADDLDLKMGVRFNMNTRRVDSKQFRRCQSDGASVGSKSRLSYAYNSLGALPPMMN